MKFCCSTSSEVDPSSESSSEFFSSTTESEFDALNRESSTTEANESAAMAATQTPKNVIIVRQGGKTESFHISGTDGLQRVEELDVLTSTTENSQEDVSESVTQSGEQSGIETYNSSESSSPTEESISESSSIPGESFNDNVTVTIAVDKKLDNTLQTNESSTEHLSNNSIEVSTPGSEISTESISDPSVSEVFEPKYFSGETTGSTLNEEPIEPSYYESKDGSSTTEATESASSTIDSSTTESSSMASTTVSESTTTQPRSSSVEPCIESASRSDDEDSTLGENPEFPYIPDDLSIHCKEIEEEEKRRSPSKVIAEDLESSSASPIGFASSSVDEIKQSHEMDLVEARAPGEPLLIPEWERSTTEKSTSESVESNESPVNDIGKTTFLEKVVIAGDAPKANKTESSEKIISSSEEYGKKEPTTARTTTKGYADTEGDVYTSGDQSIQDTSAMEEISPKEDAESIKLNSEGEDESIAPYVASYEAPSFKFVGDAMNDSFRTWFKTNGWAL